MSKLFNLAKVNTATTGTGTVALGAAVGSDFFTLSEAGVVDGNTVSYILIDGTDVELGTGVIGGSVTTMTRTVTKSRIGGVAGTTKLNLSGTAILALVALSADILTPDDNLALVSDKGVARKNLAGASRSITGTDTVFASDIGKMLLLSSSSAFTLAVTAAATLGNGFWCDIRNVGTALITIDPNSSETIDGKTTLTLGLGEAMRVFCDGTAFYTDASRGKLVELARVTNPNAATVDFDFASGWPADFDEFEVHLDNIQAQTNDTYLAMRIKTTGSLTVQTAGYNYAGRFQGGTGSDFSYSSDSVTDRIAITKPGANQGLGSGAGYYLNGETKIKKPNDVASHARFDGSYVRYSDGIVISISVAGYYAANVAWTGLRFFMSSGNIVNGSIVLYGRRK